ncbi:hypothetical protein OH76DRAFT_1003132 [Lentinus brumalis]|uniref:Uncharacterized protein n=1 Tax=Lentinus brumalis TaxID=2498619 RepID=A0A371CYG2_9APHY|nr:hypothetical protein OH76DRAFT_1003132 [Polyporus brumalis]
MHAPSDRPSRPVHPFAASSLQSSRPVDSRPPHTASTYGHRRPPAETASVSSGSSHPPVQSSVAGTDHQGRVVPCSIPRIRCKEQAVSIPFVRDQTETYFDVPPNIPAGSHSMHGLNREIGCPPVRPSASVVRRRATGILQVPSVRTRSLGSPSSSWPSRSPGGRVQR